MTEDRKLKLIAVSKANYATLKSLGGKGDSFNDVITELLKSSFAKGASK